MRRLALIITGLLVIVVLALAQLVLPGIAAQRLRDRLRQSGQVLSVEVHAFPAIELLWHHADRVVIRMGRYHSASTRLGSLLAQAGDVGTLRATAREVDVGLLRLRDATLLEQDARLSGSGRVTEADLRAAVPFLDNITPVASMAGSLTLNGTATLFGVTATADATLSIDGGDVVLTPDVPFGGLATLRLFSNPHLEVTGLSAAPRSDGFALGATAKLR